MRRTSIMPLLLVVALVAVGFWGWGMYNANRRLAYAIDAQRHRALAASVVHVQNMQDLLAKAAVSGSPRLNIINLVEVWRHANEAQANITQIPVGSSGLQHLSTWLSQSGEYSYTLAKRVARGSPVAEADVVTLNRLHDESQSIAGQLFQLVTSLDRGRTALVTTSAWVPQRMSLIAPSAVSDGFTRMEREAANFPTLTYDGPFAAGEDRAAPAAPLGNELSRDQARARLGDWVPNLGAYTVADESDSQAGARIPFYGFRLTRGGETIHAQITRAGGWMLEMAATRQVAARALSLDQARDQALSYLKAHGFPNLAPTSQALEQGGSAVLSFVPLQNDVLIYPDSLKLKLALDNGEVIGLDLSAYLLAHHQRSLPAASVSPEQAEVVLNGRLTVQRRRLAVIPLPGAQEALCYEFLGKAHGRTYLVYVNATTGDEEQILQVMNTPEGTLTM